jgi:DNA replication and repair protein RecF
MGLTVVTGPNGAGKTSLLEAIGYLSTLRSFRKSPRESLVRHGSSAAIVRGEVVDDGRSTLLEVEIHPPARDRVLRNRQRVPRTPELLESLRVTIFSPDDLILIKGGPEERRTYLDDVLELISPKLATVRQGVERVLRQRNILLRQSGGRPDTDALATLDVWDLQLSDLGSHLIAARRGLVEDLVTPTADAFRRLTGTSGTLRVEYRSSFEGPLDLALADARGEDLKRGVTTRGPHRDDLLVSLDDLDARTRLSQGRQRAATLALRLAAHEVITMATGATPLLLLDDAFSELDARTADALAGELPAGQAILTTASGLPAVVPVSVIQRLEGGVFV